GSIDVIHGIEKYAQMGHLKPGTLFVTFNMDDLTTSFLHDQTMSTLQRLLIEQLQDKTIDGLTIDIILQLVHLVLKNQFCVYNNGLYQQIHGGASGLPLTMLLTYVNLFYGQDSELMKTIKEKDEFFGRYREQAILTWHGSKDEFCTLIKKSIHVEHTRHLVTMSIGSTVHFHDVKISHSKNDVLESKVYYDPNIDTLPNVSDEPMENKSKQLHAVLYRAVRCCSSVMKFHHERRHIQFSFLTSGSTSEFIQSGIEHFFLEFGLSKRSFSCLLNEDEYRHLRQRIIQDTELQMKLKKQREKQNQHTLFIPCPKFLDHKQLADYKKRHHRMVEEILW
ncbi:unnamed protein product, partial [Rotaria magnacalcarata]